MADLQDPPELIPEFLEKWEEGYKIVIGVKEAATSRGSWPARKFYYWLVVKLSSDVELVQNFTGFGLYDREVIELFRSSTSRIRTSAVSSATSATSEPRSTTPSRRASAA